MFLPFSRRVPTTRIHDRPTSSINPSIAQAAEKLGVGTAIVKKARTVLQDPAQTRAVESGQKTVHAAASEIRAAQTARNAPGDDTDYAIPEPLRPLWKRRAEVRTALTRLSKVRHLINSARETEDLLFAPTNLPEVLTHLDAAAASIALSIPYAVCDTCSGINFATCPACQGRGLLNQKAYNREASTK